MSLFNRMFAASRFPPSWRDTLVTFVPKAGTVKFRPISLTSTLCKTFERLVQKRLEFLAENSSWIPANQFGFRRGRSSLDCVSCVVTDVLQGFGRAEGTLALALDLKGAFNAVLPGVLVRRLAGLGVPGRIVNFVNFLTTKRVLYFSATDYSLRTCGAGVLQGGVLSPLLFNLHLRGINEVLPADVKASMYADDLLLYTRKADPHLALVHLEETVGLLTPWLRELGLSISIPKCQLCFFTRARSGLHNIVMEVDGCEIRCQDSLKYLGVVLDARLTWTPHIKYIAGKAMRAIGVLRALSRVSWGVSPSLLLTVLTLVRAYPEWDSPLFAGACETALRILDRSQYEALRVALGYMRSTPIAVFLSEASEPPLGLRRYLLGGRFFLRNASHRDGPLIPKLSLLSERTRSGRSRIRPTKCGLLLAYEGVRCLLDMCFHTIRPLYFDYLWTELTIPVSLDFEIGREVRGAEDPALEFDGLVVTRYPDSVRVFGDASRDDSTEVLGVGFCVLSLGYRFGIHLMGFTSVLSAELYAIFCALKYIFRMGLPSAVVFSDSLHALYHLRDGLFSSRVSPYVFKILHLLSLIRERGCVVGFVWIPAHSGISGNEQADCVARMASRLPFTVHCGVPLTDLYSALDRDFRYWCCSHWPYARSAFGRSEYFNRVTFKTPRPWFAGFRFPRDYISLVTRLRSPHICTVSYFIRMGLDLDAGCSCGAELKSLAHLINECPILSEGRPRFFRFLAECFPGRPPEQTDLGDLIFEPDPEAVGELGRFLRSGDLVI